MEENSKIVKLTIRRNEQVLLTPDVTRDFMELESSFVIEDLSRAIISPP